MVEKYVLVSKQGMTEESGSTKMSEAVSLRLPDNDNRHRVFVGGWICVMSQESSKYGN